MQDELQKDPLHLKMECMTLARKLTEKDMELLKTNTNNLVEQSESLRVKCAMQSQVIT